MKHVPPSEPANYGGRFFTHNDVSDVHDSLWESWMNNILDGGKIEGNGIQETCIGSTIISSRFSRG